MGDLESGRRVCVPLPGGLLRRLEMTRKKIHVVFGIYSGVVSEVFAFENGKSAERKYNAIKKEYGIRAGEENEHEVKWFEVPLMRR